MMKKSQAFFPNLTVVLFLLLIAPCMRAQVSSVGQMVARGDSLHALYRFDEAGLMYSKALESIGSGGLSESDSLLKAKINNRLLLSENGSIESSEI